MIDFLIIGPIPTSLNEVGAAGPYLLGECRAHGLDAIYLDANMQLFNLCLRDPHVYNAKVELLISSKGEIPNDPVLVELFQWIGDAVNKHSPRAIGLNVFSSLTHSFAGAVIQHWPRVIIGGVGANRLYKDGATFAEHFKHLIAAHQKTDGIDAVLEYLGHDPTARGEFTPDYSCYDLDQYCWDGQRKLPMMTSRGCVRRCAFCDVPSHWPAFTWQDPKDIVRQMSAVCAQTGVRNISFNDSLVNGNLKNFESLLIEMHAAMSDGRLPVDFTWSGTYIIRRHNERLSRIHELMGLTNAKGMTIGIESGSDRIRFEMEKKFTNADLLMELEGFKQNGVTANLLFFPSWPTETEDDFRDTLALLKELEPYSDHGTIDTLGLGQLGFMLLDGTPIWDDKDQIGLREGPDSMLWHCESNPTLTFWTRVARRHRLQRHALSLGYRLTHETMFLSHAYHYLKNNRDMILSVAGSPLFEEQIDPSEILVCKMTVINNAPGIKQLVCKETAQSWKLDHGIHDIEIKHDGHITLGFKGMTFDPRILDRFDNGEIYSNDQLFIQSISLNGIDVTLTGFRDVMPIHFEDADIERLTDRNPRAIIGDAEAVIRPFGSIKGWIRDQQSNRQMMRLMDRKLIDYIRNGLDE